MMRSALVGVIHSRSLTIQDGAYDDSLAVTLMSTDVDNFTVIADRFHACWSSLLQVIIGTYLLAQQVGWMCIVPLCLVMSTFDLSLSLQGIVVSNAITDTKLSLLKNYTLRGWQVWNPAEKLEYSYSTTYCYYSVDAGFCQKSQDAWIVWRRGSQCTGYSQA